MAEICDPYAGWHGIHHKWAHCRGGEEACLTIELLAVTDAYAYVGVDRSWAAKQGRAIDRGSYIEYFEGDTRWRVYCDGVNTSQDLASIRICYEEAETPGTIHIGDSRNIDGHSFKLLDIVCGTNASIKATIDGVTRRIPLLGRIAGFPAMLGVAPTIGIAVGGLYVAVQMVGTACDAILLDLAEGGLTPEMQQENEERAGEEVTNPDGTKPTPEEIKKADDVAEEQITDWRNTEYVEKVRQLTAKEIQKESFTTWLKQATYDLKLVILEEEFYIKNFSLNIPTFVMAGEVKVSGTAPQPNQELQIMAVKKFLGFDYLASDTELAKATSDADYKYEASLSLEEFGIIEVYARIPHEWWRVLDKDIETPRHTVFVLTWAILALLIIAAALIYDKQTGNIRKMLKR